MINVLIPMGGKSIFFEGTDAIYPKPLVEVQGKILIQRVIECFEKIKSSPNFIFVLESEACHKFHLDETLKILTGQKSEIVRLEKQTAGALCSCLMAIETIQTDTPLIISNSDHIFHADLNLIIDEFHKNGADAGVVCFESVHPRWSYALVNENKEVIETAEKRPISRNAIAGFYYFRSGKEFVSMAMKVIEKGAQVNNQYYISSAINEFILENKKVRMQLIDKNDYVTFYTQQKVDEFNAGSHPYA